MNYVAGYESPRVKFSVSRFLRSGLAKIIKNKSIPSWNYYLEFGAFLASVSTASLQSSFVKPLFLNPTASFLSDVSLDLIFSSLGAPFLALIGDGDLERVSECDWCR